MPCARQAHQHPTQKTQKGIAAQQEEDAIAQTPTLDTARDSLKSHCTATFNSRTNSLSTLCNEYIMGEGNSLMPTLTQGIAKHKNTKVHRIIIPSATNLTNKSQPTLVNKSTENKELSTQVVSIPYSCTQEIEERPKVSIVIDHSFLKEHNYIQNFFNNESPRCQKKSSKKLKVNSFFVNPTRKSQKQSGNISPIVKNGNSMKENTRMCCHVSNISYYKLKMNKRKSDLERKHIYGMKHGSSNLQAAPSPQHIGIIGKAVSSKLREFKLELPGIVDYSRK
jgi:hypothetical protein